MNTLGYNPQVILEYRAFAFLKAFVLSIFIDTPRMSLFDYLV